MDKRRDNKTPGGFGIEGDSDSSINKSSSDSNSQVYESPSKRIDVVVEYHLEEHDTEMVMPVELDKNNFYSGVSEVMDGRNINAVLISDMERTEYGSIQEAEEDIGMELSGRFSNSSSESYLFGDPSDHRVIEYLEG